MENLNTKNGRDEFFDRLLKEAIEEADQRAWWKVTRAKKIDLLIDVAEDYYRVMEQLQLHQDQYANTAGQLDLYILGIEKMPEGVSKEEMVSNRDYMLQQADSYRRSIKKYAKLARRTLRKVGWLELLERVFHRE